MAYGAAAADEENLLAYGASKPVAAPPTAAVPRPVASTAVPLPNPLEGSATPFSAERADLVVKFFRATWEGCQPWSEFYSTRAFSKPSFHALSDRVRANILTYRNNYIIVASLWLSLAVLAGIPTFLLTAILFFALEKWATHRANKNEGVLSHNDRIVCLVLALVIIWFTKIYSFLIIPLFLTGVSVAAHSAFHTDEEPVAISSV